MGHAEGLDNRLDVVGNLDGFVGAFAPGRFGGGLLGFFGFHAGVVVDGGVGVLETVASEDAGDAFAAGDGLAGEELDEAGDGGGGGGLAAEAVAADEGLGFEDFIIGDFGNDALHDVEGAEGFFEVDGAGNLDGAGEGVRVVVGFVHAGVEAFDLGHVDVAVVPGDAEGVDDGGEGVGAAGVDDGEARDFVDEAEVAEFLEGFAEGGAVTEVAAGDDDPVRHVPGEAFEDAVHDGFLAFEAEGIDGVHEVEAELGGDVAHAAEAGVEVTFDLEGEGAVVEGLGKFAEGDFAGADEDDALKAIECGVDGEGGGGVAGGGAGDAACADHAGVGEGGGHAVVFEGAGGVEAFILEIELAGPHTELAAEALGVLEEGLAFADGADHGVGGEGEEVAETPDTGVIEGEAAVLPAVFKVFEALGDAGFGPVVADIEQVAALGAAGECLRDIEGGGAGGIHALLVGDRFHRPWIVQKNAVEGKCGDA